MKKKNYSKEIIDEIYEYGKDIIFSSSFQSMKNYIQHGKISTFDRVIMVCYRALEYVNKHQIDCQRKELVRGALLHDYFLYDWHKKEKWHRLHGFKHAKIALRNSKEDFQITPLEEDIILHHMFPLNIKPPKHKEAWIVCYVDKVQSLKEINKNYQVEINFDDYLLE